MDITAVDRQVFISDFIITFWIEGTEFNSGMHISHPYARVMFGECRKTAKFLSCPFFGDPQITKPAGDRAIASVPNNVN